MREIKENIRAKKAGNDEKNIEAMLKKV